MKHLHLIVTTTGRRLFARLPQRQNPGQEIPNADRSAWKPHHPITPADTVIVSRCRPVFRRPEPSPNP